MPVSARGELPCRGRLVARRGLHIADSWQNQLTRRLGHGFARRLFRHHGEQRSKTGKRRQPLHREVAKGKRTICWDAPIVPVPGSLWLHASPNREQPMRLGGPACIYSAALGSIPSRGP